MSQQARTGVFWLPVTVVIAAFLLAPADSAAQSADPAVAYNNQGVELHKQALKHFEDKNYTKGNETKAQAMAAFKKAIEINPQLWAAHRNLADLYTVNTMSSTDFQLAAEEYKKALALQPNDAETYNRLAITHWGLGNVAEAIAAGERAARLAPNDAMLRYNQGFRYADTGSVAEARKYLALLQPMDQALAAKLLDKIQKASGESSLIRRPKSYTNPKIELVWIKPGNFELGGYTSAVPNGQPSLRPGNKITMKSGYYIGKYPVTQAQWQAVMGDNPSFFKKCGGNCPVEQVSWHDAQAFVFRLNQLNDGYRYRLPSETEWEFAYRGGTTTMFYAEGDIAWTNHNSGNKTHPVGEKLPNGYGLYDMGGHVKEWCQDWYVTKSAATDGGPVTKGDQPMKRVLRGTSFYGTLDNNVTIRNGDRVDEISRNNGFRVAAEKRKS